MHKSFSLVELIFVIIILGIIASFAVPKFLGTKDSALASTLKRDTSTVINSVQTYYLLHNKIDKISDSVTLNTENWNISDLKLTDKNSCIDIELKKTGTAKSIDVTLKNISVGLCKTIKDMGVITKSYPIY